jgi:hypothetical protein
MTDTNAGSVLPVIKNPHSPELGRNFTSLELRNIAEYGRQCAEHVAGPLRERVAELEAQNKLLSDDLDANEAERDRIRAENKALASCLRECSDDLESEVEARRGGDVPRRIERDLEPVRKAREILAARAARE